MGSSREVGIRNTVAEIKTVTDEKSFLEYILWLLDVAQNEALELLVTDDCKVALSPQSILPVLRAKYPQVKRW